MNPIKEDKSKKQPEKLVSFSKEKEDLVKRSSEMQKKVVEKQGKSPLRFSSQIYISSFSQESVLKCKLKENAPGRVIVSAGCYLTGQRVFNKDDQPFRVTEAEWRSVLNRGQKLFYLIGR